ncbi:hypothetical protein EHS25_007714 [Saitozyma podzolica]|uniref:DUF3074 domain-containing protein n=1 Tax=Saitozyma podzolica TaxID=1890683 RepID=A0A427YQH3_9TREE|nr:hypothetical protein EHS25_007714 [Saitozyma podzolica]
MPYSVHLDLQPLRQEDIPNPESPEFAEFLDAHFDAGEKLIESMEEWHKGHVKCEGEVQIMNLNSSQTRKSLGVKEYWCGRQSAHTPYSVRKHAPTHKSPAPHGTRLEAVRSFSRRFSRQGKPESNGHHPNGDGNGVGDEASSVNVSEVERQAAVMTSQPHGLYERFRRGLLEYHSENEREYIESCRETQCLQVFQPHVAEVWRLTYVTPPPTNPRTFVVLLLSRELKIEPLGERCFMNISLPFEHPECAAKTGEEKSRVRGKYVSVERVRELEDGEKVEWKMATSSDAGGNIPRFVTNSSLPNSISEDVPSFLKWMVSRFPEGTPAASTPSHAVEDEVVA